MPEGRRTLDLLVIGELPPRQAGAAISLGQLLVGLAGRGHRVRAVAPITAPALGAGDAFAGAHPRISVTRFLVPYFLTSTFAPSPDEYRARAGAEIERVFRRLLAERPPDVIVIGHESYAWHLPMLRLDGAVPSVLLVRGHPTRGILDGSYPEPEAGYFLDQYRMMSLIITVSHYLGDGLRHRALTNVRRVANAVDTDAFASRPRDEVRLGICPADVTVMHLSNLSAIKRPLDIVDSAAQALPQNPNLVYVVVGDGPLRDTMEQACRQKGNAERFRFVGWIDYDHVPAYVGLADMVVMPSEAEGLSRVYLETQACARLLLASDIAPAREVIVDGQTGLLFRKGDVHDLAAKTLLAAADPGLRAAIGRKARQRLKSRSLDDAVAAYVAAFEAVIRRTRKNDPTC